MIRRLKYLAIACPLALLMACSGGQQWQHSSKTKYDFAIDDRECQHLAEARAQEESMVSQPILSVYFSAHNSCLYAKGWRPAETISYTPKPIQIKSDERKTEFTTADFRLVLDGPYNILNQQPSSVLVENEGTYLYLMFQLDYPRKLERTPPVLSSKAVYFDTYQTKDLTARFYYQEAAGKLVFACTAYLFVNDESRVVLSLSKELFDMPTDFLSLPPEQFTQLTDCRHHWEKLFDNLARQL